MIPLQTQHHLKMFVASLAPSTEPDANFYGCIKDPAILWIPASRPAVVWTPGSTLLLRGLPEPTISEAYGTGCWKKETSWTIYTSHECNPDYTCNPDYECPGPQYVKLTNIRELFPDNEESED